MIRFAMMSLALFLVSCAENETVPKNPNVLLAPAAVEKPVVTEKSTPATKIKPGVLNVIELTNLFGLLQEDKALLVDVRPGVFYSLNHIPGAISFPRKSFTKKFSEVKSQLDSALKAGKIIVLYCTDRECPDARAVANLLNAKGYDVAIYPGGWGEWKQSGL